MRPFFIGGYPKSGTTLTLSLFDGHPELLVFPEETLFFRNILPLIRSGADRQEVLRYTFEQTGIKFLRESQVSDGAGSRDYSNIDFKHYTETVENLWSSYNYSEAGLLQAIVVAYGVITKQDLYQKKYWVEKSPGNEYHIKDILKLFPDASVGCILRDPRANYFSYQKKRIKLLNKQMSTREFLLGWITSLYAIMKCQKMISRQNHCSNGEECKFFIIIYEQLTNNPFKIMNNISSKIEINWDDCLLKPTRNKKNWNGNSMHGYLFEDLSTIPVNLWKTRLNAKDIRFIESVLGERLFNQMGWDLSRKKIFWIAQTLRDIYYIVDLIIKEKDLSKRQKGITLLTIPLLRSNWININRFNQLITYP